MKQILPQISDWEDFTSEVVKKLNHNILVLKGNLGAGKTTFTQYLLQKLNSSDEVSSPTYSIVNEYQCPKGKIYHFDLYRLKSLEEAYDFGIEEYLDNAYLSIIEWPEIYENELSNYAYHEIKITVTENGRIVEFK